MLHRSEIKHFSTLFVEMKPFKARLTKICRCNTGHEIIESFGSISAYQLIIVTDVIILTMQERRCKKYTGAARNGK